MALTQEEIVYLFRCFLGREPSEGDLDWWAKNILTFEDGRMALINSAEFVDKWFPAPPYIPKSASGIINKHSGQNLAIVSIVKDEAERISQMLASTAPVADHFVILDTGSTDETEKTIRDCLAHYQIPLTFSRTKFTNFAQARNEALSLVKDDIKWILMMDADEHLVQEDYQLLLDLLVQPYHGWRLPRYNFSDLHKKKLPSPYPDYQSRLFRNRPEDPIRYTGLVHEQPTGIDMWRAVATSDAQHGGPTGGPHIHHMGHVTTSAERMRAKHDLYNELMLKARNESV